MPTIQSAWYPLDLGVKMDDAELGNADVVIVCQPVPLAGIIKEIWLCADVLPTSATVAVAKAEGTVDTAVATTVTINTGLTANVGSKMTLDTNPKVVHVDAGNMIRTTWTFTTIGSGTGFGALMWIEPDTW
jgi:hypothetical protein